MPTAHGYAESRSGFVGVCLLSALALGVVSSPVAATEVVTPVQSWSAETVLQQPTGASDWQVMVSADGSRATAIWSDDDRVKSASATIRGNSGNWGAVTTMGKNPYSVRLGLSADGSRATAVWFQDGDDIAFEIHSASATITGNTAHWGASSILSAPDWDSDYPDIALSADGSRATVVWCARSFVDDVDAVVQTSSASITGNTSRWGSVTNLATGCRWDGVEPQVALSADGTRATAVLLGEGVTSASATIAGTTATWGPVTTLRAPAGGEVSADLGLSADGTRATSVWSNLGTGVTSASATITGNTASWGASSRLYGPNQSGGRDIHPHVGLSAEGTMATAIWSRPGGEKQIVESASATITGNTPDWAAATKLAEGQAPQVAVSADGTQATAVWSKDDVATSSSASVTGNSASWGAALRFSDPAGQAVSPAVDVSADGSRATAVWLHREGRGHSFQAASAAIIPSPARTGQDTAAHYRVRPGDTLWRIADAELGDPYRWTEIAEASTGVLQPDGQELTDPNYIRPGWTLLIPVFTAVQEGRSPRR